MDVVIRGTTMPVLEGGSAGSRTGSNLIQRHGFLAGLEGCELSTAFRPGHAGSAALGGFGLLLQKLEGTGRAWLELAGELSEYDLQQEGLAAVALAAAARARDRAVPA